MRIITAKGEIIEGQELTAEEASILSGIAGEELNYNGFYLLSTERQHIARHLITHFYIRRRHPDFILPPSPGTEYVNALAPALAEIKAEEEATA